MSTQMHTCQSIEKGIMREYKEQQQADLLYQLKIKKNESKEGNAK